MTHGQHIDHDKIAEAFAEFITGSGAQRVRLHLSLDGVDVSGEFVQALHAHGYEPMTVGEVIVHPGERVPAFYLVGGAAYFGWVFWEKFTEKKLRKLWGSALRNRKGDWDIQIPTAKQTTIYANVQGKIAMDLDHPD